jgi:acyl-CoA reductase-like NAD-dependent aldehyde dehydrogenase
MQVLNPATGAVITELDEDTPASLHATLAAARAAQPAWAERPLADRVAVLHRFRDALERRAGELAAILTAETGKPVTQSRAELAGLLPRLDFFLAGTGGAVAPYEVHRDDALVERVSWEPLGVVANISAWNYPWFVGSNVFVPALLTGNAVIHKPSELASCTGVAVAELLHGAGVPEGVFALALGGGAVGAALVELDVDGVFFTGSHATGARIARAAAGRMIRVQLELGGKDPVYVCEDVEPGAAAASVADGAFYNAGQSCCAVERLYVHERIHDELLARLVAEVEAFTVGDPTDPATYLGPLTRPQQASVLAAQVDEAVGLGATLLTGGTAERAGDRGSAGGTWFRPTVLAGVSSDMAVMRDESFGPILGVQRVSGDDEAVALMNDTAYGLTAGVYSADEERARAILARVDAGSAYWNCCDRVSPRLPWSGRHHSGLGSTLSTLGIQAFVQPKAWHLRRPAP